MYVGYNPYESSLILRGIPQVAGEYKVYVHLEDKKGRQAESNKLDFKVFDITKIKLSEQLQKAVLKNSIMETTNSGTWNHGK